jgi:predicted DCC family thiol-disulfide oxidoreductase YuxK
VSAARTVIFDDDCGFCTRSVNFFRSLDWLRRYEWLARSDRALPARYPRMAADRTAGEMVSVRPDGGTLGGFYAVRDILLGLPLTFLPALFMYVPGVPLAGVPVYRWIAKNRHRFGGTATCAVKK